MCAIINLMGGVNVKNTIVEHMLQLVAPHPCFGCGKVGSLLCQYCKYDIISEPFVGCILCSAPHQDGICARHQSDIEKAYVVSQRTGVVKSLLTALKAQHLKAAAQTAATLLDESLPSFPPDTVIVPIPTSASRIRQRGYDQTLLIARHFAQLRSMEVFPGLERRSSSEQKHLSKTDRVRQARATYALSTSPSLGKGRTIIVLDDIITTGATVSAAASLLSRDENRVIVAALAYQPLD